MTVKEVADEQRTQLEVWAKQYDGRPDDELQRLLLLALEREQLVAVAYRDHTLARRLAELHVPEQVRAAFSQALSWAWRDEQQHTVFTRGLLLASPHLLRRATAWVQVSMGAVAGWASSTQHHATWRRAPVARAAAKVVTTLGTVAGKVPRSMRRRLQHLSFRDYCQLQRHAEISAAMCWERMTQLARESSRVDATTAEAFHLMWQHELRHRDAFAVMESAITDDGGLEPGRDPAEIVAQLRSIAPMFVPRSARLGSLGTHPLGAGGVVHVVSEAPSGRAALRAALERGGLLAVLNERAQSMGRPLDSLRVLIKPSFMLAYDREDRAVYTDPQLVQELALWLREQGVDRVTVGEAPNLYERFFAGRSVEAVAHHIGMEGDYELVDLTEDLVDGNYAYGLGPTKISRVWRDADVRILFPKARSHPVDFAHLCFGGLEGVAGRIESYLFAERRAERETATLMPLVDYPPHFGLVEGWDVAGDGLVGMIACPRGATPRRIWAGADVLAVDLVAMRHLGLDDVNRCELLATAMTWFGDPTACMTVTGADRNVQGWRHPFASGRSALLALLAYPVFQHAGARGAMFAPRMDAEAFPPLAAQGWWLRWRRGVVRWMIGIDAPLQALPPSSADPALSDDTKG